MQLLPVHATEGACVATYSQLKKTLPLINFQGKKKTPLEFLQAKSKAWVLSCITLYSD